MSHHATPLPPALTFRPIDLSRHADLCARFRADSFTCGDGTPDRFYASAVPTGEHYLAKLAAYSLALPGSCVHAFLDDKIVGQIEMIRDPNDPHAGKINLFYLSPAHRLQRLGPQLDRYATTFLRQLGLSRAWLRVSPTNAIALSFYARQNYHHRGPDPRVPPMLLMEKSLTPP